MLTCVLCTLALLGVTRNPVDENSLHLGWGSETFLYQLLILDQEFWLRGKPYLCEKALVFTYDDVETHNKNAAGKED